MIRKVAVVGAGTMGAGIAQVAAQAGYDVVLFDVVPSAVEKGLQTIEKSLAKFVEKGSLPQADASAAFARIQGSSHWEALEDADYVTEAVTERMAVKQDVFRRLDAMCRPEVILATNTSGLSITEIAASTNRPEKVVGTHFFNPVPIMKLVEIIRGERTSEETVQTAREWVARVGKETIEVKEAPLFTVNRILVPMINEAIFVLQEGISTREDIDRGMKLGANHPIGPLALADLIGLDTLLFVMETLYEETGDSKYRPCPLLRKLVRAGKLGRKTGEGFYTY